MKLRSGLSYWRAIHPEPPPAPRLCDGLRCEVAVLGGGITGALVVYLLIKEGVDAVLIDRRQPSTGSTAASTGLLQYEADVHLVDMIKRLGEDRAVHAYRRGLRAVDEIEALVVELGYPCGFSRRDSLYFASSWWHARRLRREYECRRDHGFDVRLLRRGQLRNISSLNAPAALHSSGDGQVDPFRLTVALLSGARRFGLRVYGDSPVLDVRRAPGGFRLRTAMAEVHAEKIVYATGYESGQFLPRELGSRNCTYAAVSQPMTAHEGWPEEMLIWETARPYFYARRSDDGRAIIGGEDTAFASDHERDGLVQRKTQRLKDRFERLFPQLNFEPEFAWAGTFAESPDGLPYIGSPPDQPDAYFAVCYGGNGITFGMIAARLIADLCRGRKNPDERAFGFGR